MHDHSSAHRAAAGIGTRSPTSGALALAISPLAPASICPLWSRHEPRVYDTHVQIIANGTPLAKPISRGRRLHRPIAPRIVIPIRSTEPGGQRGARPVKVTQPNARIMGFPSLLNPASRGGLTSIGRPRHFHLLQASTTRPSRSRPTLPDSETLERDNGADAHRQTP